MWGRSTRGAPPASAARRAAISSSRPRLPGGFVRLSRWRWASASPPAGGGVIALRSLASIVGPRRPRRTRGDGLERERHAGHHQHDAVARGGDLLVHDSEEVAETEPHRGLGVHALARSEEHTSELQSQSNLVCRLLLEKKKINTDGYYLD